MDRRVLLNVSAASMFGWGIAANAATKTDVKPAQAAKTGMKHRTYKGKVAYLDHKGVEIGREWFNVSVQPNGERTLRAMCEMDDFRLMRDVTATVNAAWQPVDAYVRITVEEKLLGSSWFHFTDDKARCHGFTAKEGLVSQEFDVPERVAALGTHPLHADSWTLARLRQQRQSGKEPGPKFSTSMMSNGGSGPLLVPPDPGRMVNVYVGPERIKTDAGTFDTEHFRMDLPRTNETMKSWAMGEDCVPVRQIHVWPDRPDKVFELVELEGDYR